MMTKSIQTAEKYKSTATEIKQRLKKKPILDFKCRYYYTVKKTDKRESS